MVKHRSPKPRFSVRIRAGLQMKTFMAITHGGRSWYLLFWKKYYSIQAFFAGAGIYMIIILTLSKFGNYFFHLSGIFALIIVLGPFLLLMCLLYRYFKKKEGNFSGGLRGEGVIFFTLKKLINDYIVFQDVEINGYGNIDFVVLAPTGIFALEVKAGSGQVECIDGKIYINGKEYKKNKNILGQTKSGAEQVKGILDGVNNVHPLLVFASSNAVIGNSAIQCGNVRLLNNDQLISYITSMPRVYSHEQLESFEKILLKFVKNTKKSIFYRFLDK